MPLILQSDDEGDIVAIPDAGKSDEPARTNFPTIEAIDQSESQRVITNMLRTYYQPLEAWYLRTSIEKVNSIRGVSFDCHTNTDMP